MTRRRKKPDRAPDTPQPEGRPSTKAPVPGPRRRPILRFVITFGLCMLVFYAITSRWSYSDRGWIAYLDFNARVSGHILNALGSNVAVTGRTIASPRGSILIEEGCDAIHPSALFVSAVLASPVALAPKLLGALAGTLFLSLVNLVRIISLYYIQIHFPGAFEVMHVDVWQAVFIFLALACWVAWAWWALQRKAVRAGAVG